ncbi:MAG TPA: ferrochelatase [Casimicrobiaceae bacterium]|nr:ferrochelatase [Casimicrobiaceae bacterium]
MSRYSPEPPHDHTGIARIGVLLVNLGTPDAPTAPAVRRYLREFLTDPRVVEIPRAVWLPILHGVVLRTRPAQSARKYAAIWTKDGSPLLVHSLKQRSLLKGLVGERLKGLGLPGDLAEIEVGMRYGEPGIASALGRLRTAGCDRVLVVPLYPQYAASATASALDAVFATLRRMRRMPALRTLDAFHDDPGYIRALAQAVNDYWMRHGRPDQLVLSFHGVPRRTLGLGDPYFCQCQKTARLLVAELGLSAKQYVVSFQSRFGRAEWLQPYTAATAEALAKQGKRRIDVFCPGFVSDCLETLEEIGLEVKQTFLAAGGKEFHAIPCLNEQPLWIAALADLVLRHLEGWLAAPAEAGAREMTQARALAAGAPR